MFYTQTDDRQTDKNIKVENIYKIQKMKINRVNIIK